MECHEPSVRQAFLSYLIFIDIYFQIIEQSTLVVCDFNKLSKKCVFGGWMNGLNGCVGVLRHHPSPLIATATDERDKCLSRAIVCNQMIRSVGTKVW